MINQVEPAWRLMVTQLWWVASTVARRHPELTIGESVRAPGLVLLRDGRAVIELNRDGYFTAGPFDDAPGSPVFEADDPYAMVAVLESAAGLTPPPKTPAATARTLTYRVACALLTVTANDKRRLSLRIEGGNIRVERDGDVVATLGTDGHARVGDTTFAMPEIYQKNGRSVTAVLHTCFRGLVS